MASVVQSHLPVVTTTRFDVSQGKTISVQDFLRGLKRPVSKPTLPSTRNESPATKAVPKIDASQGKTISIYEFLGALKRPASQVTSPSTDNQVSPATPAVHNALRPMRPLAEDPSILDPPESYAEDAIEHTQQDSVSLFEAEKAKATVDAAVNDETELLKAPKVVRTYVKKPRQSSPPTESLPDESPFFCTQSSVADHEHRSEDQEAVSQTEGTALSNTKDHDSYTPTAHEPQTPGNSKSQALQPADEGDHEPTALSAADTVTEKTTGKRKRRRAPVNELALVAELPLRSDSPANAKVRASITMLKSLADLRVQRERRLKNTATLNSRSAHLNNHKPPEFVSKSTGIAKAANEANIGKSVTKCRRDIVQPRRGSIDPDDFKFPPTTPKSTRSPGWKLGSWFEGITLETSNTAVSFSHRPKAKRAKTVRFMLTPLGPLELSNKIWPISPVPKTKNPPRKGQCSIVTPPESAGVGHFDGSSTISGKRIRPRIDTTKSSKGAKSDQNRILAPSLQPPIKAHDPSQPGKSPIALKSQRPVSTAGISLRTSEIGTESSQAIRPPSKSERNGWLKRRRRVSFVDADEQDMLLDVQQSRTKVYDGSEQLFDSHNATWYDRARSKATIP